MNRDELGRIMEFKYYKEDNGNYVKCKFIRNLNYKLSEYEINSKIKIIPTLSYKLKTESGYKNYRLINQYIDLSTYDENDEYWRTTIKIGDCVFCYNVKNNVWDISKITGMYMISGNNILIIKHKNT
ncbi:hypothetical protein OAF54_03140, partial [bacterium]|nr:hypothetical protein [bacterium]